MSEMIERCIDALEARFKAFVEESSGQSFQETKVTLPNRAIFKSYVMAVLNAAREPSADMIKAVDEGCYGYGDDSWEWVWQTMIDAAMKDEKS